MNAHMYLFHVLSGGDNDDDRRRRRLLGGSPSVPQMQALITQYLSNGDQFSGDKGPGGINVHMAPQSQMLMDMFNQPGGQPRLDFIGHVSNLTDDVKELISTYQSSPMAAKSAHAPLMKPSMQRDGSGEWWNIRVPHNVKMRYINGIDADVLCRLSQALYVDYKCLMPPGSQQKWCKRSST